MTRETNLMWAAQQPLWPPKYPRQGTALIPDHGDPTTPREEWGVEEWKRYALFLESEGAVMVDRLRRTERLWREATQKLRRSKKQQGLERGDTALTRRTKKRGRPPSQERDQQVREVMAIKVELQRKTPKHVTNKDALEEWYVRKGYSRSQAKRDAKKNTTMLSAISRLTNRKRDRGS